MNFSKAYDDGCSVTYASGSLSAVCCWVSFSPRCSRAGKNALQKSLESSMGGWYEFAASIRIIYSFCTIIFQWLYVEFLFFCDVAPGILVLLGFVFDRDSD